MWEEWDAGEGEADWAAGGEATTGSWGNTGRGRGQLKRTIGQDPPLPPALKRHKSEEYQSVPPQASALARARTWSSSSRSENVWASHAPNWQGGGGGRIGNQDRADIKQWLECTRVGTNVPGTPLVPCKTPFEGSLATRAYESGLLGDEDWFDKADLLRICAEQGTPIGLVIDLVNTQKYYPGFSEEEDGVEYQKISVPGRTVPPRNFLEGVFDIIDDFVARRPDEHIAIHCTHGVNRTGFLVSAYLMTRAHLPQCRKAVAAFEQSRGIKMDKEYLLEALMDLQEGKY